MEIMNRYDFVSIISFPSVICRVQEQPLGQQKSPPSDFAVVIGIDGHFGFKAHSDLTATVRPRHSGPPTSKRTTLSVHSTTHLRAPAQAFFVELWLANAFNSRPIKTQGNLE
jgi:hypothetical protein